MHFYYALFHCLARSCADLLVGGSGAERSEKAWRQTYRALEHRLAERACRNGVIVRFPESIRDFANTFVAMQKKRHDADYDPHAAKLSKSEVQADIALVEQVIADYQAVKASDKRAFCIYVLFKVRSE